MRKAILVTAMLALVGCQTRRVDVLRVESQFGNPIRGATVGMSSMNSGHPIYPDSVTDKDGLAPLQGRILIGPSFIFTVAADDQRYIFEYSDLRWDGATPVIRIKDQYQK